MLRQEKYGIQPLAKRIPVIWQLARRELCYFTDDCAVQAIFRSICGNVSKNLSFTGEPRVTSGSDGMRH
jgi:hypothetical protein